MSTVTTDRHLAYWLALTSHGRLGLEAALELLRVYGTLEAVTEVPEDTLAKRLPEVVQSLRVKKVRTEIPEYVEMIGRLRSDGVTAIPMIAGAYPKKLLELEDPPATLFCRGNQLLLNRTDCVAIVGTREPSDFGAKMSFALGRRFAMAGFVVVSGLAFGIDAAAHRGALEGGGATMAVLPSYVGNIVPKGNANIAERILNSGGALVSEYPPGAPVLKENFVARNRIIAALASSTIVVEGTLRSGTRHQARFARRLDRPLFVLAPRDRSAPAAELPLYLMEREGAKPVTNEVDALQEIRKAIESYCYQVTLE